MSPTGKKPPNGFTLLELILVIALLAVILAVVAPRLSRTAGHLELATAAQQLASLSRYAHDQAIVSGRSVRLVIDPGSRTAALIRQEGSIGSLTWGTDPFRQVLFPRQVRVQKKQTLIFSPDGQVYSPNGEVKSVTLLLSDEEGNEQHLVIRGSSGRVRVETPSS